MNRLSAVNKGFPVRNGASLGSWIDGVQPLRWAKNMTRDTETVQLQAGSSVSTAGRNSGKSDNDIDPKASVLQSFEAVKYDIFTQHKKFSGEYETKTAEHARPAIMPAER
ncbi:hypothetical protein MPER_12114 [Moniliophthora perniciosa FA553]|nr:hypothetical protein MPER_12114 [Moniliophthora perniciosa FA553]